MRRVLVPGGTLVVSSMRPDADTSKLFLDLIAHLENADDADLPADVDRAKLLSAARDFVNRAADLLRRREEGLFRFYSDAELAHVLALAGFEDTVTMASFGSPPQAVIVRCRRP
jgi:hypothetical protein